jgi:hypothetical protein
LLDAVPATAGESTINVGILRRGRRHFECNSTHD